MQQKPCSSVFLIYVTLFNLNLHLITFIRIYDEIVISLPVLRISLCKLYIIKNIFNNSNQSYLIWVKLYSRHIYDTIQFKYITKIIILHFTHIAWIKSLQKMWSKSRHKYSVSNAKWIWKYEMRHLTLQAK